MIINPRYILLHSPKMNEMDPHIFLPKDCICDLYFGSFIPSQFYIIKWEVGESINFFNV